MTVGGDLLKALGAEHDRKQAQRKAKQQLVEDTGMTSDELRAIQVGLRASSTIANAQLGRPL